MHFFVETGLGEWHMVSWRDCFRIFVKGQVTLGSRTVGCPGANAMLDFSFLALHFTREIEWVRWCKSEDVVHFRSFLIYDQFLIVAYSWDGGLDTSFDIVCVQKARHTKKSFLGLLVTRPRYAARRKSDELERKKKQFKEATRGLCSMWSFLFIKVFYI